MSGPHGESRVLHRLCKEPHRGSEVDVGVGVSWWRRCEAVV